MKGIMAFRLFFSSLLLFSSVSVNAKELNFDTVVNLAQELASESNSGQVSLEEFVDRLGMLFPALRHNHVLMHDSRSLQVASPEFPRVIAFDDEARFVMAFNGKPHVTRLDEHGGYHELEMMSFATDENGDSGFQFKRINFENGVHIGETNEKLCLSCHRGPSPRPNWESYNQWPGRRGA